MYIYIFQQVLRSMKWRYQKCWLKLGRHQLPTSIQFNGCSFDMYERIVVHGLLQRCLRHALWLKLWHVFAVYISLYLSRWWFQIFFIFTPKIGEDYHFDKHIFQMGWFNHQPVLLCFMFFNHLNHSKQLVIASLDFFSLPGVGIPWNAMWIWFVHSAVRTCILTCATS